MSFSSPKWGLEGEEFNTTLVFENVTEATSISLTPNWARLNISETEIRVDKDTEIVLDMIASHFYLFKLNMSCSNSRSQENAFFEVRSKKCLTLTFQKRSCIVFRLQVPVGRTQTESLIAKIFQRVMAVFLAFAMLLMGCELKFDVVRSYLRRPLAPAAGMVCQYLLMPVMAFLIGLVLMPDNVWARYGLILIGSSPGGSFSNFWTGFYLHQQKLG